MYWTIGQFPELKTLEPAERAAVLRKVPWGTYPLMVARGALPGVCFGAMVAGTVKETVRIDLLAIFLIWGLMSVAGTWVAYVIQMGRVRVAIRGAIREGFKGERLPFCMGCGYDLRGSAGVQCPECGRVASA